MPEELAIRDTVFTAIKSLCENRGFVQIDTPAIENIETLTGKYGAEGDQLIFKILKRGEKSASGEADMALRYDLTVPTMRFFARNRGKLPKVFKRYQFGPVWRADRPGKGRYREFFQFDFDVFGSRSIMADIECMKMLTDSLLQLNIEAFTVNLNSREIISSMMAAYQIPSAARAPLLRAIDKTDKIGVEGVIKEIGTLDGTDSALADFSRDLARPDFTDVLLNRIADTDDGRQGIEDINAITSIAADARDRFKIVFNPFMVRGLDYYTGPIYEITSADVKGSIAAGGRYDKLSKVFTGEEIPVCGSSLGIERILLLLKDEFTAPTPERIYVGCWSNDRTALRTAYDLVAKLREAGLCCDMDLLGSKIGKQISYAAKAGYQVFVFQGPEEQQQNTLIVKDLASGQQREIPYDTLLEQLQHII